MERYPSELTVKADDLALSNWQDIVSQATETGYDSLWIPLSKAASGTKLPGQRKALWLLADACAMRIHPGSDKRLNPFTSTITRFGWISAGPEDFTATDLDFFIEIIKITDNPWLKARLADLLWVRKHKEFKDMALLALDCYQRIPLSTKILEKDWKNCWKRAITLGQLLAKQAAEKLGSIQASLLQSLGAVTKPHSWLARDLSELLQYGKLARDRELAETVAKKLEFLAHEHDTDKNQILIETASSLFLQAEKWYTIYNNITKAIEMKVHIAECFVREANSRIETHPSSYSAAASFCESAIQVYRSIPKKYRAHHDIDNKIKRLRLQMDKFSLRGLEELHELSYSKIDLQKQINWAQQAMQNKTMNEALKIFTNIAPPFFIYENLKKEALAALKKPSLLNMFPVNVFDAKDGRIVCKIPTIDTNCTLSEEQEHASVFFKMTQIYMTRIKLCVQAYILPALKAFGSEYNIQENVLLEITNQSSLVPEGRAGLFCKALFAGFNDDFASALHLLLPQIEHMVRYQLKLAGANTTHLDKDGIQTENGLSTLVDLPEMESIFSKDLAYEFKALLCSPCGPNIRNKLAHGLIDDKECYSIEFIYTWWLGLRLVFQSVMEAERAT